MSTSLFMTIFLGLSAIICLMSNSWLSIWVLLEVNTLSFCALLQISGKAEGQKNSEMMMKYLIIQSIASAILILSTLYMKHSKVWVMISLAPLMALMIKAAAIPVHQWFVEISKNLSWGLATILFTWQKLAPIYLMIYQLKTGILFFVLLSAIGGASSMMNKKQLKEIMAWSSIFNLSWMMFSLMVSMKVFIMFMILYWISAILVLYIFMKNKSENMEELSISTNKSVSLFVMMNLAGLPPFIGFLAKWMTFTEGLKINLNFTVTLLLITSAINLYVYLRLMSNNAMKTSWEEQKTSHPISQNFFLVFLFLNGVALVNTIV